MTYQLHYWPGIQGRGEFVRLTLEAVRADYVDVARQPKDEGGGEGNLLKWMSEAPTPHPPFAPPVLVDGDLVIGQTANILLHLGFKPRSGSRRTRRADCGSISCS